MNSLPITRALCSTAAAAMVCIGLSAVAQKNTDPSASDKRFVREALEGGNAEVQLGQLAVDKGKSQDVKQFGQKMIDDHTKLGIR